MATRSPALDAEALEHVGEAADLAVQLLVGEHARVARLALADDRGLVAAASLEVAVEAVVREVEAPADEPLGERRLPVEHLRPRRRPRNAVCAISPQNPSGSLTERA